MNDFESNPADDWIGRMAREHYNPPPATPREEMWGAVEARIEGLTARDGDVVRPEGESRSSRLPLPRIPVAWLALAASAILALGVGLGRWSRDVPHGEGGGTGSGTAVATEPEIGSSGASMLGGPGTRGGRVARLAAVETLVRSEPLLATVRADASRGAVDAEVGDWARRILRDARFLLDSGLPLDPQLRALLEDLELVLLQTTLVGAGMADGARAREELELLRQGMDDTDVLTRIQAVLPGAGAGL
jgi:hypothetical protein